MEILRIGLLDLFSEDIDQRVVLAKEKGKAIGIAVWLCDVPETLVRTLENAIRRFEPAYVSIHVCSGAKAITLFRQVALGRTKVVLIGEGYKKAS